MILDGLNGEVVGALEAMEAQLVCYRQLAKLAARQHEFVQNDETESLLDVLRERQVILERAQGLEGAVGPAKKDWTGFLGGLSGEVRARAEVVMGETRRLLAEIMAGDEKDALALQQRKHAIGNEIKATGAAKVVNRHYAASAYGKPRGGGLDARS